MFSNFSKSVVHHMPFDFAMGEATAAATEEEIDLF
jgi:hypothetical protein